VVVDALPFRRRGWGSTRRTDGGVPDVDAGVIGLAEYRWREDKAVISDFGETCLSKLIVSP
jgi:hypothetical protein